MASVGHCAHKTAHFHRKQKQLLQKHPEGKKTLHFLNINPLQTKYMTVSDGTLYHSPK